MKNTKHSKTSSVPVSLEVSDEINVIYKKIFCILKMKIDILSK